MINIAYIIDTIETPNAGTEKQLLMLMKSLDRKRFHPHLICLRGSPWLKKTEWSFPVFILNLDPFGFLPLIKAFRSFRRYCIENNVAVVQTFFRDANVFGTLAAYLSGIKVVISSRRNYGLGYWHNRYWIGILRVLRHITRSYIANSRATADYTVMAESINPDKIHVIHNGLKLHRFKNIAPDEREGYRTALGIQPDHILIGAIANLRPVKNLALFVRVAAMAYNRHPSTRFVLVGDGPERPKLERMIKDCLPEGIVRVMGEQNDIIPILYSMDIGVLCSKSESLSNSVIEYMAAGLPCLVSEVGGNLEAIGYEYGLSFRSDDEKDFFAKLERLIVDEQLRSDMGCSAKTYAFHTYDQERIVRAYEKIYEKCYPMQA
jgi:glycosyltransferase involved in cell wall biosynthesis